MRISDWSSDVCSSDLDDVPAWEDAPQAPQSDEQSPVGAPAPIAPDARRVAEQAQAPSCAQADSFETMHIPDQEYFDDAGYEPVGLGDPGADEAADDFVPPQGAQDDMVPALFASRSEEHTSELQSLMRISYAVFCLKKKHQPYFT